MLHELLFSLLGFVGDIIIDDGSTFKVKDGFDLLRESERDLVNRIAPLGWYYVHLGDIVERYDISWANPGHPQVYLTSTVQAVSDLRAEYVANISFLEQLILSDGPMPLSQVLQHLQKYLLIFPELHTMLLEAEAGTMHGCQLLDYFHNYNTGVPVLKEVIDRIVLRLRVVFVKQCFAWMVHGELEDPGREFFVQAKDTPTSSQAQHTVGAGCPALHEKALAALFEASRAPTSSTQTQSTTTGFGRTSSDNVGVFDWTTSFSLSLSKIPSSHVSPRLASKIVFAGKAVKLLQSSGVLTNTSNGNGRSSAAGRQDSTGEKYSRSEAYRYLCRNAEILGEAGAHTVNGNGEGADSAPPSSAHIAEESVSAQAHLAFQEYVESGGYSVADTQRFTALFSAVLEQPDRAVELLEAEVEAVNDCISNHLWLLLRDTYGFTAFLQVIRSTYLLGRGELFQGLLDGILQLTYSRPPETLEMDNLLNWKVLRTSAKLVGLESDDSLNDMLTLRVSSASLTVRNFALHAQDLLLVGAAQETPLYRAGQGDTQGEAVRVGQKTLLELCRLRASSSQQQFEEIWMGFIRKRAVGRNTQGLLPRHAVDDLDGEEESLVDSLDAASELDSVPGREVRASTGRKYVTGAVWVAEAKAVSKGFEWSTSFICAWNDLRRQLTASHLASLVEVSGGASSSSTAGPFAQYGARVVELGSVSCHVRGDRRGTETAEGRTVLAALPLGSPGSLVVGAAFYAMVLPDVAGVRYFARLFLRTGQGSATLSTPSIAGTLPRRHDHISVGVVGHSMDYSSSAMDATNNELVWAEGVVDIDGNLEEFALGDLVSGSVSSASAFRLDVEYNRSAQRDIHGGDTASVASQRSVMSPGGGGLYHGTTPAVVYTLRARLVEASSPQSASSDVYSAGRGARVSAAQGSAASWVQWGLELPITLANHVKCQGGQAFVGVDAVGLVLPPSTHTEGREEAAGTFSFRVQQLHFAGRGTVSTYPVTSVPTAARHPDTAARVQEEVDRVRAWMHLKLQLAFPPMFRVIFDAEAVTCYERVFALIMKVRVVAHALERLWIARSRLASDRSFCQSRHSMHFFVSNLLYYLQVDVVDSEYSILQKDIAQAEDFQSVLRAHKTFTSNVLRLSLIDNASVQEGIDRILHICLRFIAICRIMHRSEFLDVDEEDEGVGAAQFSPSKGTGVLSDADRISLLHAPIYVPPEELDFIRRDFFAQVSLLFQLMRKVESRGFIFRLDFNNYLSNAAAQGNNAG